MVTGESSVCKGMDSAGHRWGSETGEVTIGLGHLMVSGDLDKSSFSGFEAGPVEKERRWGGNSHREGQQSNEMG